MRWPGQTAARLAALACLLLTLLVDTTQGIKWLALSRSKQRFWNQTVHCTRSRRSDGLVKHQVHICKQNLELMRVIAHASRDSMRVCSELFGDRRWNCSSIGSAPNYLADLTGGSREQGFVYALTAAALTQSIAKACSMGVTTKCQCGRLPTEAPPGEFKWGGCGDDVRFGLVFSKMFADASWSRKRRRSKRIQMNAHNNAAGRKVVAESLRNSCKCHGVSGSCSIKTCWKALPDLRVIGVELQKRYAIAVEVQNRKVKNKRQLVPAMPGRSHFTEDDLIYYTQSPDYCLPDESLGSLGTRGRECRKTEPGSGGCRSMCCGRGYSSEVVEMKQRCDCKYYWCCYVKCKTCIKKVEINRCR